MAGNLKKNINLAIKAEQEKPDTNNLYKNQTGNQDKHDTSNVPVQETGNACKDINDDKNVGEGNEEPKPEDKDKNKSQSDSASSKNNNDDKNKTNESVDNNNSKKKPGTGGTSTDAQGNKQYSDEQARENDKQANSGNGNNGTGGFNHKGNSTNEKFKNAAGNEDAMNKHYQARYNKEKMYNDYEKGYQKYKRSQQTDADRFEDKILKEKDKQDYDNLKKEQTKMNGKVYKDGGDKIDKGGTFKQTMSNLGKGLIDIFGHGPSVIEHEKKKKGEQFQSNVSTMGFDKARMYSNNPLNQAIMRGEINDTGGQEVQGGKDEAAKKGMSPEEQEAYAKQKGNAKAAKRAKRAQMPEDMAQEYAENSGNNKEFNANKTIDENSDASIAGTQGMNDFSQKLANTNEEDLNGAKTGLINALKKHKDKKYNLQRLSYSENIGNENNGNKIYDKQKKHNMNLNEMGKSTFANTVFNQYNALKKGKLSDFRLLDTQSGDKVMGAGHKKYGVTYMPYNETLQNELKNYDTSKINLNKPDVYENYKQDMLQKYGVSLDKSNDITGYKNVKPDNLVSLQPQTSIQGKKPQPGPTENNIAQAIQSNSVSKNQNNNSEYSENNKDISNINGEDLNGGQLLSYVPDLFQDISGMRKKDVSARRTQLINSKEQNSGNGRMKSQRDVFLRFTKHLLDKEKSVGKVGSEHPEFGLPSTSQLRRMPHGGRIGPDGGYSYQKYLTDKKNNNPDKDKTGTNNKMRGKTDIFNNTHGAITKGNQDTISALKKAGIKATILDHAHLPFLKSTKNIDTLEDTGEILIHSITPKDFAKVHELVNGKEYNVGYGEGDTEGNNHDDGKKIYKIKSSNNRGFSIKNSNLVSGDNFATHVGFDPVSDDPPVNLNLIMKNIRSKMGEEAFNKVYQNGKEKKHETSEGSSAVQEKNESNLQQLPNPVKKDDTGNACKDINAGKDIKEKIVNAYKKGKYNQRFKQYHKLKGGDIEYNKLLYQSDLADAYTSPEEKKFDEEMRKKYSNYIGTTRFPSLDISEKEAHKKVMEGLKNKKKKEDKNSGSDILGLKSMGDQLQAIAEGKSAASARSKEKDKKKDDDNDISPDKSNTDTNKAEQAVPPAKPAEPPANTPQSQESSTGGNESPKDHVANVREQMSQAIKEANAAADVRRTQMHTEIKNGTYKPQDVNELSKNHPIPEDAFNIYDSNEKKSIKDMKKYAGGVPKKGTPRKIRFNVR